MAQRGATVPRDRANGAPDKRDDFARALDAWEREFGADAGGVPGRRTVTITGHGSEGWQTRNGTRASSAQRLTQLKRHERDGFRPDRIAMWAVLLGVVLLLVAVTSSHAAVLAVHALH